MNAHPLSRRGFLRATALTTVACSAAPFIRAQDKTGTKPAIIGTGEHTYECHHGWGDLPSHLKWGETHGVAVDEAGFIYIKNNTGPSGLRHQDCVVVFDPAGKFVRSFGSEYSAHNIHTVGHGIDLRKEGNTEYLYLTHTWANLMTKTTLQGEIVWALSTPWEAGVYKDRKEFIPTNVAFHPTDGSFYLADGYGTGYIHRYSQDGKFLSTFGGKGGRDQHGKFATPHGLWVDARPGREPQLCICDRANARLEYFTLDGQYTGTVEGLSYPAHLDTRGDVLLCPDLHARVSLFGKDNQLISHLGFDQAWTDKVLNKGGQGGFIMRTKPETWENGRFIHPHDACFDRDGNIFVVEWVSVGRVTKLRKVG
jgi:hypothetical protein